MYFYAEVRSCSQETKMGECKGRMTYNEINYVYVYIKIIHDETRQLKKKGIKIINNFN